MENYTNQKKHQFKSIKEKLEILDCYHELDSNGNPKHTKAEIIKYFGIERKSFNLCLENE